MLKTERSFDYVKINLASPSRIRNWGERTLPNGENVGEVKHRVGSWCLES